MPEQPKIAPISSSSVSSHRWHGGQRPQPTPSGAPLAGGGGGGGISTCVGMTIYLRHFVVNLAPPERSSLPRSSPFSRCYSARLKGAHVFREPRRSRALDFCNGLFVHRHLINDNRGAPLRVPLMLYEKNKNYLLYLLKDRRHYKFSLSFFILVFILFVILYICPILSYH